MQDNSDQDEDNGDEILRRLLKTPPQPKEAKEKAVKPKRKTKDNANGNKT